MSDESLRSELAGLAKDWVTSKRRTLQSPSTRVDSGGTVNSYSFKRQDIDHERLREVKDVRDSGGLVAQLVHAKALMNFGTGVEWNVEDDAATEEVVDGEPMTLEAWLEDTFNDLDTIILDVGEDTIWYPYGAVEISETRGGNFGSIVPVEPYTLYPQTDRHGEIVNWIQETHGKGGTYRESFEPDDIKHFIVNKSSARDKTGISQVLRSEEEITQYKENQRAMQNAIKMHGFPEWHVKAGREGAAPLDDNELRRIIQLFEDRRSKGDTVTATGPDVDLDRMDPGDIKLEEVTSNDLQQLALALGVPIEAVDFGSEGLGSGEQSKLRETILKLDILATQRTYTNQWMTEVIRPVVRDYSPFDHTVNMELELNDPLTGDLEMAELISKVGDYMETNEARAKLNLPERDDLEGEYGAPGDSGSDDGLENIFGGRELGSDTDFSHLEAWERSLMDMHAQAFENTNTRILNFTEGATPEFVKDRIRDTILSGGGVFSDIEGINDSERMQLREYLTESLTSDGWTIDGVADQLMQLDSIDDRNYAELVAESETAGILNTTRMNGYEEQGLGESLFYWSGNTQSEDSRTTEACDWLIKQTNPFEGGDPVPKEQLKELIKEAPSHDPDMNNNLARPDDWMVHPRERKQPVRAPPDMT